MGRNRLPPGHRGFGAPRRWQGVAWLVLAAGVGLSVAASTRLEADVRAHATESFRAEAAVVGSTVTTALRRLDDLTVAARTLIGTDPTLTNAGLAAWYRSMGSSKRYPGALGFGYVQVVPAANLASHAAVVRADPVPGIAPADTLTVTPPGRRARYCLIRLAVAEPIVKLLPGGAGYDLCDLPGASAFLPSADAGRIGAVSASMPAFGQILIVSAPVYRGGEVPATVTARRSGMLGWVVGAFNLRSVLGSAIAGNRLLGVSISRQSPVAPARAGARSTAAALGRFTSVARLGQAPARTPFRSQFLLAADGRWIVTVVSRAAWGRLSPTLQAIVLLAAGISVSLLAFVLIQVLSRGRARALRMVAEKTEQLRHQALHDALTGLPNRTLIVDRAQHLIARLRRGPTEPAALFLDLDDFKAINDTFGHGVGDELLRAAAARISAGLRGADTIGRLGGDEFVVLIESDARGIAAERVAARLLEILREPFRLAVLGHEALSLSASIGIACGDRPGTDELLRDADTALYRAKEAGKHRFAVFNEEMHATVHGQLALAIDLHAAVERGQLFLEYQPIYRLAERRLTAVEALLRWRHPTRGIVRADEFIAAAESTGMIGPIGRWVLERACGQARAWHAEGHELAVSVNISALQLDDPGFRDTVADTLAKTGLDAGSLILEITETVLMHHPDLIAKRLAEVKTLGVRVAVDDFGTGYSSLAYLERFPVDVLKIDRSFVERVAESPESGALIHTLIQLGKALDLETVAEGIETESQLALLRRERCELGQGFLLSRPLEPAALLALLDRESAGRALVLSGDEC